MTPLSNARAAQRRLVAAERRYRETLAERDASLRAAHEAGASIRELAADLGLPPATVFKATKRSPSLDGEQGGPR